MTHALTPWTRPLRLEHNLEPPATSKGLARDSMRAYALKNAAINIEALAGGGDLDHARKLRDQVLAADAIGDTVGTQEKRKARKSQHENRDIASPCVGASRAWKEGEQV